MGILFKRLGYLTLSIAMLCICVINARAALDPQFVSARLEAKFASSAGGKGDIPLNQRPNPSATILLNELKSNRSAYDPSVLHDFGTNLERPDVGLDRTMYSNNFRIHFTIEGEHAIHSYDGGYPVGQVLAACEESWWTYVVDQNWPGPLPDSGAGSDDRIDVYVMDIGENAFGYAMHEDLPDQVGKTGFIVLDSHIKNSDNLTGLEILKSTIAHEYHHLIQFSYGYRSEAIWFMEQLAMMEEHQTFGEVFDTLQELNRYLPTFTENTNYCLDTETGSFNYGAWLWPQFLSERFSMDTIIRSWEIWRDDQVSMLEALDQSLGEDGSSLSDAVSQWATWNVFLDNRDDGAHYELGRYYSSSIHPEAIIASYPRNRLHPDERRQPQAYAASYLEFRRQGGSSHNLLSVNLKGCENLKGAHLIIWAGDGSVDDIRKINVFDGQLEFIIEKWDEFDKAWLVVTTGGDSESSCDYVMDARTEYRPISGVDEDWLIGDQLKLRNAPNPFEPFTKIFFNLPQVSHVSLKIFSPEGRLVRDLVETEVSAGGHAIFWDGADGHGIQVPSGVFYAILRTEYSDKRIRMVRMQ
jgi:hypothetical protein